MQIGRLSSLPMSAKKNVCVLSSLHMSVGVDLSEKRKAETIKFHNKTKCEVDVVD